MAPQRVKRNLDFLKVLYKANKCQRHGIIKGANKDLIICLCECADNLLKGNIPIKEETKQKLRRHKKPLRELADKKSSLKVKREILCQRGGFLPLLLAPVLSIAGSLIADAISSR